MGRLGIRNSRLTSEEHGRLNSLVQTLNNNLHNNPICKNCRRMYGKAANHYLNSGPYKDRVEVKVVKIKTNISRPKDSKTHTLVKSNTNGTQSRVIPIQKRTPATTSGREIGTDDFTDLMASMK